MCRVWWKWLPETTIREEKRRCDLRDTVRRSHPPARFFFFLQTKKTLESTTRRETARPKVNVVIHPLSLSLSVEALEAKTAPKLKGQKRMNNGTCCIAWPRQECRIERRRVSSAPPAAYCKALSTANFFRRCAAARKRIWQLSDYLVRSPRKNRQKGRRRRKKHFRGCCAHGQHRRDTSSSSQLSHRPATATMTALFLHFPSMCITHTPKCLS